MENTDTRQFRRYNHICIKLNIKLGEEWKPVKALDWNENGFNFDLDHELKQPDADVLFKKSGMTFSGAVIWSCRNEDDDKIMETILNAMLFSQIKNHGDILKDSLQRIISLLRSQGVIDEKIKMLSHLGVHGLSQDTVRLMAGRYKKEHPAFRYGIHSDSPEWKQIFRKASQDAEGVENKGQDEEYLRL